MTRFHELLRLNYASVKDKHLIQHLPELMGNPVYFWLGNPSNYT